MRSYIPALLVAFGITMGANSQPSADSIYKSYKAQIGSSSALFNGPEYYHDESRFTGHSFLESPQFAPGTVVYDGILYNDVPLAYDILRDEVVTLSSDKSYKVKLVNEKLSSFSLRGKNFIRLNDQTATPLGYYEIMISGKATLLAKRSKKVTESKADGTLKLNIESASLFYVFTNSRYDRVTDKASLLQFLNDQESQLNSFISSSDINFRLDLESALLRTVSFYNQTPGK